MNMLSLFSLLLVTRMLIDFLSLENSRVANFLKSCTICLLYCSTLVFLSTDLNDLSTRPTFSARTFNAASVGNPVLVTLSFSHNSLDSLHKLTQAKNCLMFAGG